MIVGLSIIVPTIGRPELINCLHSITTQATDADQVIVVHDGTDLNMEPAYAMLEDAPCDWALVRLENHGFYGHPARNYAMDHVVDRPRVMSIDDDDIYLPGALDTVRDAIAAHQPAVHIFGCRWPRLNVQLPHFNHVRYGNIGTPMIVAPCCTARWGHAYDGDFHYAQALEEIFGEFVWHPDRVIAEVRPVTECVEGA